MRLVVIRAFLAVCTDPGKGFFIFGAVINFFVDSPYDFAHVGVFTAHVEIVFKKIRIHDGSRDSHCDIPDGKIRLSAHQPHRKGRTGETQNLFPHIFRNAAVIRILHVFPVDSECGESLLCVSGKHGGEIDRSRALRTVEAPDRLLGERVHVHGFGSITPAGSHAECGSHIQSCEFLCTCGRFGDSADRCVRNDALDRLPVRIPESG